MKWKNFFSYARKHLFDMGHMESPKRGVWKITDSAYDYLDDEAKKIALLPNADEQDFTELFYIQMQKYAVDKTLDDERATIELANEEPSPEVKAHAVSNQPIARSQPFISKGGKKTYRRDPKISQRALYLADYRCELNSSHKTFIRRNSTKQYMEPHHLLPMAESERFEYSLDREQNIFSLCCNCHTQIHYGKKEDVRNMVAALFEKRKEELFKILGREITLRDLYAVYKV